MAGAGYKLFNTGDVLTAAQVNTYLMEQTVMVFDDATARSTALTGVVSEGMISYLKDTNAVEVYNGSAWVASDDPNAIQNTIVDAKGDLITATAADTPARLAVGNNGETLVADSSASTGLRWQGNFAAGKNKIINGDFGIWQRGTSFSGALNGTYTADRWGAFVSTSVSGLSWAVSQQTFTAGSAPVSGYEGTYFLRADITTIGSAVAPRIAQRIEDVRTFAGQDIVVSWWGRSSTSTTITGGLGVNQVFGSGGSTSVAAASDSVTYTTSWQRFSQTVSVPSISGKTIGAGSYLEVRFLLEAANGANVDIWGVQLEAGNVATAFQTATGTLAGELAACQRYYQRTVANSDYGRFGTGIYGSSTNGYPVVSLPVAMRVAPTSVDYSTLALWDGGAFAAATNVTLHKFNNQYVGLEVTVASGGTQYRPCVLAANNSTTAYLGFSAEL